MFYYQHHIGDFTKDTHFLTNEEVGIYLKLIWLYYDTELPLPDDINALATKTNARSTPVAVSSILDMFFTKSDGFWHHTRCDEVIAAYKKQQEVASRAGKASGNKRKANARSTPVERPLNDRATNHKPLTVNHEPIALSLAIYPDFSFPPSLLEEVSLDAMVPTAYVLGCLVGFKAHFDGRQFEDKADLKNELVKWVDREWRFKK